MSLKPIVPGLRNIHHNSHSAQKVDVVIQADAVVAVPGDVADQLLRASQQFKEVTDDQVTEIEARKAEAAEAAAAFEAEVDASPAPANKRPAKRAAKKAPAKPKA